MRPDILWSLLATYPEFTHIDLDYTCYSRCIRGTGQRSEVIWQVGLKLGAFCWKWRNSGVATMNDQILQVGLESMQYKYKVVITRNIGIFTSVCRGWKYTIMAFYRRGYPELSPCDVENLEVVINSILVD